MLKLNCTFTYIADMNETNSNQIFFNDFAGQHSKDTAARHFPGIPLETAGSQATAYASDDGYQTLKNIDRSQMQCLRKMDPTYALIALAVYGSAEADNVVLAAEELAICEHWPTIPDALAFGRGDRQLQPTMFQQQQNQQQQPQHLNRPHCHPQPSNVENANKL